MGSISPDALSGVLTGMGGKIIPGIILGMQYLLALALVLGILVAGYLITTYTIKVQYYPLYGSGKDGVFAVGKKKWNRVKWIKNRTAWKPLLPLFGKKEIEPFDSEYIYPGKQVYAFDLNGEWQPGRINVNRSEEKIRAEINPTPYYIRNWQSLQHKKHALEFSQTDWWSENKTLFTVLAVSICCLAAVCLTAYLTYQHAGNVIPALQMASDSIKGINVIPGAPR